ncbi:hypothetical protein J40TS1_37050 [Paenibacillus montaniterrae]|uniref:Uncharacterized protein n=1 Tax=Paenibacillus montaniterrae TaxID=429341 RepID=A0A919YWH6_9BACL|nr:hypothetical protein [Paenibacillus montaniterrae]GIP18063.1 hypothetical protein J40TS1_37050 [Paenibacillus montaniterrae]
MRILAALLILSLSLGGMTGCTQKPAVTANMFEAAIEPLSEVKAGSPFQVQSNGEVHEIQLESEPYSFTVG